MYIFSFYFWVFLSAWCWLCKNLRVGIFVYFLYYFLPQECHLSKLANSPHKISLNQHAPMLPSFFTTMVKMLPLIKSALQSKPQVSRFNHTGPRCSLKQSVELVSPASSTSEEPLPHPQPLLLRKFPNKPKKINPRKTRKRPLLRKKNSQNPKMMTWLWAVSLIDWHI